MFVRAGLAALCLVLASASAAETPPPVASAPEVRPIKDAFVRHTMKVADRVHLIYLTLSSTEAPYDGNSVVFEQSDGLVVVDAGGAPVSGRHIVEQIRKLSPKPVKYLIYTHYHGDHNLGAGEFRKAWPHMVIVSTEATRRNMTGEPMAYLPKMAESTKGLEAFARQRLSDSGLGEARTRGWRRTAEVAGSMHEAYAHLVAYPADLTFEDRIVIPDEAAPVEVMFLGRANTDGDAVVWAPKQRVVAAGDIVVAPAPYASASFPTEWIAVLKKLEALDYAFLVPGHGPVMADRAYPEKLIGAITEVQRQVTPLAKQGLSLEEVRKRTDFKALRQSFGDDWDAGVMQQFFVAAFVGNVYREARGIAIVQGHDGSEPVS